jgi:uncharacterized membrane protein
MRARAAMDSRSNRAVPAPDDGRDASPHRPMGEAAAKFQSTGKIERLVSPLLGIIGLSVSLYMVGDHFNEGTSICDLGSRINCSVINKGAFSELLKVPISVLGAMWYVALIFVMFMRLWSEKKAVAERRRGGAATSALEQLRTWALAEFWMNVSGIAFVFYLVGVEILVGVMCPMCTVIHVMTVVTMFVAWRLQKRVSPEGLDSPLVFLTRPALRLFSLVGAACALAVLVYFNLYPSAIGPSMANTEFSETAVNEFAQCLTNRGFRMYGSLRCGFCMRQKALFGDSFEHVNFVDCDGEKPTECDLKGVEALPTWIQWVGDPANSAGLKEVLRLQGMQSFESLQDASRCELMN